MAVCDLIWKSFNWEKQYQKKKILIYKKMFFFFFFNSFIFGQIVLGLSRLNTKIPLHNNLYTAFPWQNTKELELWKKSKFFV